MEHLEQWLNFVKFILASVVVGLITFFVNTGLKERQIALEEQKHLASFKDDALIENVAHRRRLAEYFANVTQSADLKKGWKSYLQILEDEFEEKQQEENDAKVEIERLAKELEDAESKSSELKQKIDEAQQDKQGQANMDQSTIVALNKELMEKESTSRKLLQKISSNESELSRVRQDLVIQQIRHPYIGGVWVWAKTRPSTITQFGVDGKKLIVTDTITGDSWNAKFMDTNSFQMIKPGEPLYTGTVSEQGMKIVWDRDGKVWLREESVRNPNTR